MAFLVAFDDGREVAPVFDFEPANVSHDFWEPRERFEGKESGEEICHVIGFCHVNASLDSLKIEFSEDCSDVAVCRSDASRMVLGGIGN